MLMSFFQSGAVGSDFDDADLGDERLDGRLKQIVEQVDDAPGDHFPRAMKTGADLEAFYRFGRNPKTGFYDVIRPHLEATARRVESHDDQTILAIHDTTTITASTDRYIPGMGRGSSNSRCGFLAHTCLAIQSHGARHPLGLLDATIWRRGLPTNMDTSELESDDDVLETMDNESDKWDRSLQRADRRVDSPGSLVHLMDAGADKYARIARLVEGKSRFVMRMQQNRRVVDEIEGVDSPKLNDCFQRAERVATRTISLSARDNTDAAPSTQSEHPSRPAREATVAIEVAEAEVKRPSDASRQLSETAELQLVRVREVDPPEEGEPVDWKLLTDVDIDDKADAMKVVRWYQRRWCIEEYFGVLKGGCAADKRLLRSADTYTTAFGVLAAVAWRLLLVRSLAQNAGDTPADEMLRTSQLEALKASDKTPLESTKPTASEAFDAIAKLGGHQPHNGPPGWKVLTRAWKEMTMIEIGIIQGRQVGRKEGQKQGDQRGRKRQLDKMRQVWDNSSPEEFEEWLARQEAQICDQS